MKRLMLALFLTGCGVSSLDSTPPTCPELVCDLQGADGQQHGFHYCLDAAGGKRRTASGRICATNPAVTSPCLPMNGGTVCKYDYYVGCPHSGGCSPGDVVVELVPSCGDCAE